ncbi:hypothetical protein FCH28_20560 [Streptomyces piniterrae]|uniref:Uncharacterized protein n=1 Tax=Streptomyces piniterrae TaxID=2571125 RepID=A0A4V5MKV3_9ACTN|nr:hypothetical protein [Streptomyces piniterrae]TJZ50908.1 hypothetical protein FCH28_20560 [Streptomyces piniterrae]
MTKHVKGVTPDDAATDPESLDQLRGDCARMAPRWKGRRHDAPPPGRASDLHGIKVPDKSAELVDGMSDYGD